MAGFSLELVKGAFGSVEDILVLLPLSELDVDEWLFKLTDMIMLRLVVKGFRILLWYYDQMIRDVTVPTGKFCVVLCWPPALTHPCHNSDRIDSVFLKYCSWMLLGSHKNLNINSYNIMFYIGVVLLLLHPTIEPRRTASQWASWLWQVLNYGDTNRRTVVRQFRRKLLLC